jgi:hypothetical protein
MRVIISILAVLLGLALGEPASAASPRVGPDGSSLVLDSNDARKTATSKDTLYELLGQEVQVFIFNNKTRVFPQVSFRPISIPWRVWSNPQLEGMITKYAAAYGVDPFLVRAVIRHESAFNPGAISPKGAQGLMQLMPGTADLMGVRNPFDPEQNIAGGVGYLRLCLDRFGNNVPLAVAAYNAGPESVARYGSIPPYLETQVFVNNVMGSYLGQYPMGKISGPQVKGSSPGRKMSKQDGVQGKSSKESPRRQPKIIEVRSSKTKEPRISSRVIRGMAVDSAPAPRLE